MGHCGPGGYGTRREPSVYILKNALRCIGRQKGRNILIGVIVFVIALSCCIGLSIRQAAESAKQETLASMQVTATISFDRAAMMAQMGAEGAQDGGGFDRGGFADKMGSSSSLTLDEYQTYAAADSVADFYYSLTSYVNGSDGFEPVSTETEEDTDAAEDSSSGTAQQGFDAGFQGQGGAEAGGKAARIMGSSSDFTLVGYSGENAMTAFLDGTAQVTQGAVFTAGTAANECIVSEELATFNGLAVGDTVAIANPNNEDETYTLTVTGFYTDSSANGESFSRFGSTSTDPANRIYVSAATLQELISASEDTTAALLEDDAASTASALSGTLAGTYVFASVEDYEAFEPQARELGLDETYTVTSADVSAYENSLVPLNTLSTMAGYFLIVVLVIGAIILVVLNIFNIRERKYEIGVLTAIGMKKGKVALQFLAEIFVVTLLAVAIGAGVGALSSVPVTNQLLEGQVASQVEQSEQVEQNFGRGGMDAGGKGMAGGGLDAGAGADAQASYVSEVSSAMNLTVVAQMLGIALLLTLVAGAVSMLFVMRYEPLKILANRD